jgi:hypothetical protein
MGEGLASREDSMPDQDNGQLPEAARGGGVPAVQPELAPAEAPPALSVGERMAQLAGSGLADGAPDDADEALFDAAFGRMDGLDPEAGDGVARIAAPPVCAPPDEVLAVLAAAGNGPLPLLPGPEGARPPAADMRRALGMFQISELDGYLDRGRTGQSVRALGRMIFGRLPCFVRLNEMSRRAGQDPLGQVWLMTTLSSMQPRPGPGRGELAVPGAPAGSPARARIDALAAWVRGPAGGILVDAAVLRFAAMPGYSANVMLYATEGHTYLLVEERQRNGAPVTALYAYSFPGGMQIYRQGNNANRPLERLGAPDADGRHQITVEHMGVFGGGALAGPPPAVPAALPGPQPPGAPRAQRQGGIPDPAAHEVPPALPARNPRGRPRHLDAAAVARPNAMRELRAAGFLPCGTHEGPALQRQTPDGGSVLVLGEGRSLALAARFSVRFNGPDGDELERDTADGAGAAIAWADTRGGTAPRP